MRTLLHLSDLHFGCINERLLQPLLDTAARIDPDLVVISGDLTQRARAKQFQAAKKFLAALPGPQVVVPGNHDVPLYNVFARFFYPLAGYRRHIGANLEPFFQDDEIAVLGLNSSRSLTIEDGRLSGAQMRRLIDVFDAVPPGVLKILVCHHPFELPPGLEHRRLVGGAARVLAEMAACGVDVALTGHLHTIHACSALHGAAVQRAMIIAQAGTATSTRLFGQQPSFNVLRTSSDAIGVEQHIWSDEAQAFVHESTAAFKRAELGWSKRDAAVEANVR